METVREAVAEVVTAADAQAQETVTAVVAAAEERIDEAQENARKLAEAAMNTELGRRIETNSQEIAACQGNLSLIKGTMENLTAEMAELKTAVAASLTLQAATLQQTAPAPLVSLTPPVSELAETAETIAATLPGNLSENAVVESPVPAIVKARKRFL